MGETVLKAVTFARSWTWRAIQSIDGSLVLLLVLSLLALTPLASPGYFFGAHDGRHSIFYVEMFDQSIRDGVLWPIWAMHHNQGYGYPTFLVQAPLAFYVAELFLLVGFSLVSAVKLAWASGFLASAWGMYALVKHWLLETNEPHTAPKEKRSSPTPHSLLPNIQYPRPKTQDLLPASSAALVAGLLYVFIPYHLLDIYVRAAFAETMLMAWFPWVILAFDRLIAQGSRDGWAGRLLVAALCFAGLLLTHVFALLAFTPLLIGFVFFRLAQKFTRPSLVPRIGLAAAAGISAVLLASIFILPLLAEGPLLDQEVYTRASYDYTRNWVFFGQFFNPFWGFGFSDDPTGVHDGMGFQVGAIPLLLAGVSILTLSLRNSPRRALQAFLLVMTALLLLVMTPAADFLWQAFPLAAVIQFPWRLLAVVSLTVCGLGGLVVFALFKAGGGDPAESAGLLLIGLLAVFAGFGYAHPEKLGPVAPWRTDGRAVAEFEEKHPDMIGYTSQVQEPFTESAMTDVYRNYDGRLSLNDLPRLGILDGQGQVTAHYSRGSSFGGKVEMATAGVVQVRVYDFPGWRVQVDGAPVPYRTSPPRGLIELDVPAGDHRIDVRMGLTQNRLIGRVISGSTLLLLVVLWLMERRRRSTR